MRWIAVILTICCAVSSAQLPNRPGGDDDRWIWGDVDKDKNTDHRNDDKTTTSTTEPTYNPVQCSPNSYDPPKPSFKAPGRKISEEKCEEYKWSKKVKEEQQRRSDSCQVLEAVGGRPTYSGEFPHMGAIGWEAATGGYVFKCGSTLISSKFVLTAAHCSKASSLDTTLTDVLPKIIRLNDKNLFQTDDNGVFLSEDVHISRIIVHPEFKPPKKYFDIALMELQMEVTFSQLMQPACLWTKPDVSELGREATLTGWGVLHSGSYDISPELQAAVVTLINSSYCDQLLQSSRHRNWWGLQEHQLCAGELAGGVDACQGDSGGPLQVRQRIAGSNESVYYVIGVTSFGIGCALPNTPGIYTRVSSFVDWIEGYVWPLNL